MKEQDDKEYPYIGLGLAIVLGVGVICLIAPWWIGLGTIIGWIF